MQLEILQSLGFQAMRISTIGYVWDWKYYSHCVEFSIPVEDYFFAEFILL